MRVVLAVMLAAAACTSGDGVAGDGTTTAGSDSGQASSPAASRDTSRDTSVGVAATKPTCPATGQWSVCAVVERLDRAGLAPRVDSSRAVEESPLTMRGTAVRIGRSELELYVYGDQVAREREQARLDRARYLAADAPMGMSPQPTLLLSGNLIGILHSRNEHQRERVSDAIAAGPPQPPRP